MTETDALAAIIAGCQRGQRDAQRKLFDRTNRQVLRIAARLVGETDADDVAQQVYLQVFRKIGQFAGRSAFGTWLYRVTVNEARQRLRIVNRNRTTELKHDVAATDRCLDEPIVLRELLQRALESVDADLKIIFLLRETEGLTYCEIANVLEISSGTVASRLSRARQQLQIKLKELGWYA